jgi:hypothetical protein
MNNEKVKTITVKLFEDMKRRKVTVLIEEVAKQLEMYNSKKMSLIYFKTVKKDLVLKYRISDIGRIDHDLLPEDRKHEEQRSFGG